MPKPKKPWVSLRSQKKILEALTPKQRSFAERMFLMHRGVTREIIKRYGFGLDWQDCESLAQEVLINCVQRFKPKRGFKFSTYYGRMLTLRLWKFHKKMAKKPMPFSVIAERAGGLLDLPSSMATPLNILARAEELGILRGAIESLPERERQIIKLRFGLSKMPRKTVGEIGKIFGISKQWVYQLEKRALKKLYKTIETKAKK